MKLAFWSGKVHFTLFRNRLRLRRLCLPVWLLPSLKLGYPNFFSQFINLAALPISFYKFTICMFPKLVSLYKRSHCLRIECANSHRYRRLVKIMNSFGDTHLCTSTYVIASIRTIDQIRISNFFFHSSILNLVHLCIHEWGFHSSENYVMKWISVCILYTNHIVNLQ